MTSAVNPPRRRYNSPLRADQAQETRRRILASALELFAELGYARTTLAMVADRAGVATETIYNSVGSKRALLEGVIDSAIAGDDPHSAQEEGLWTELAALPDPMDRLARMVDYSCEILARTRPVHAVIRGAADKEAFAAALGRRRLQDRLAAQTERIARFLAEGLRPGLSVEGAGQRYCVLASPELYYLLTVDLRWSADQHRRWLVDLLQVDLLAPTPAFIDGTGRPA